MFAFLTVLVSLSTFSFVSTRTLEKDNFQLCTLGDKSGCSGHGKCVAYQRPDKKKGTRCVCDNPFFGAACDKKRVSAKSKAIQEPPSHTWHTDATSNSHHNGGGNGGSHKKNHNKNKSSSSSSDKTSDQASDSDITYEYDDSSGGSSVVYGDSSSSSDQSDQSGQVYQSDQSSWSDESSSSDQQSDSDKSSSSDGDDDDDGHHKGQSDATWWALAFLIVLVICFCIPAIVWCVWRQRRVRSRG
jgi:hypothetical protein